MTPFISVKSVRHTDSDLFLGTKVFRSFLGLQMTSKRHFSACFSFTNLHLKIKKKKKKQLTNIYWIACELHEGIRL